MAGTGDGKLAILVINSERKVAVQATEGKFNPNTEGHGGIDTHNVDWHSSGKREYSIDVEYEQKPGMEEVDPMTFDENNPVDVVMIGTNNQIRFVQGVLKEGSIKHQKDKTNTVHFTLHQFKDRVVE